MTETELVPLRHLTNGRRTICGLTHQQAGEAYRPDAPACEVCGPRSAPNEYVDLAK